jgi:hypothetical protein
MRFIYLNEPNQTNQTNQMNFIRRMMKPNGSQLPQLPQLGRWKLNYDPKIVHSKVDQANEDHCGCCHVPDKPKSQEQAQPKEHCTQKLTESEEYYVPYCM